MHPAYKRYPRRSTGCALVFLLLPTTCEGTCERQASSTSTRGSMKCASDKRVSRRRGSASNANADNTISDGFAKEGWTPFCRNALFSCINVRSLE